MKKTLSQSQDSPNRVHASLSKVLCPFFMFALLGFSSTWAYDFSAMAPSGHTLYYSIIDASSHTVAVTYPGSFSSPWTDPWGASGHLIIPDSVYYGGVAYSITAIGERAFYGCSDLSSVTIPSSVTYIGLYAFKNCYGLNEVISNADIPPSWGGYNSFPPEDLSIIAVSVPCGSWNNYRSSMWGNLFQIVEMSFPYSFHVMSSNELRGSIYVNRQPSCAYPNAVVSAIPAAGYSFDHWSNGATQNPYSLTLTSDTVIVAMFTVAHDSTDAHDTVIIHDSVIVHDTAIVPSVIRDTIFLTQHDTTFVPIYFIVHETVSKDLDYYSISLLSNDSTRGMVAGNGRFPEGTEVEIAAVPIEGNRFVAWSDGSTEQTRTITTDSNIVLYATFEPRSTEGINDVMSAAYAVSADRRAIVVKDAVGERVRVFDVSGRVRHQGRIETYMWRHDVSVSGIYFVQIADNPAQKVVVID